ncbi:hsp20/alpha crystallin family domain-containing protein [Ditylenchus destructor]|uniref:Hsp20/alpha crystallin family domain-containing protein n=1 Tax=Ditylenchus destructor TaxID=166010 RepID=A0AAD4NG88_9BILA|nr:hsp20/alpha crystallin family domain-containing protein [Ditylenchus destructor]
MSLLRYDPLFNGRHRRLGHELMDPFGTIDAFFDNSRQLQVRDHAARLSLGDNGEFKYQVDVSGFHPEELEVNIEGDDIVVRGQHQSRNEDEQVERSFMRRVRIPTGIHRESIQSHVDDRGHLSILGQTEADRSHRRTIPIGFKQAEIAAKPQ